MLLCDLLENIEYKLLKGTIDTQVDFIEVNSKKVKKGSLFFALKGNKIDGHSYIKEALQRGATTIILCDNDYGTDMFTSYSNISVVKVADTRKVLSQVVNKFYNYPSKKFNLVGVTGTNGKTSVVTLLNHICSSINKKCGLIGTINNYCNNKIVEIEKTNPTTPDCIELGQIMKLFVESNVTDVFMEVSSMSLKLNRVQACEFDIGVFTNISPEHLDDHKTMEDYKNSKLLLFKMVKNAVVNVDDEFSKTIINSTNCNFLKYGIKNHANCDVFAKNIKYFKDKVSFDVVYKNEIFSISLNTPVEFAVYNALSAICVCVMMGIDLLTVKNAIEQNVVVEGRYDVINSKAGITVIIDYAHTPMALESLLSFVKKNSNYNRLITVFGCGGDRDKTKRAVMGNIASKYSEITIVTSDNPRSENPKDIIEQIESGITKDNKYELIIDRKDAIEKAIKIANVNDVVVIAGKGHENYQIFDNEIIPFYDKQIAQQFLEILG